MSEATAPAGSTPPSAPVQGKAPARKPPAKKAAKRKRPAAARKSPAKRDVSRVDVEPDRMQDTFGPAGER